MKSPSPSALRWALIGLGTIGIVLLILSNVVNLTQQEIADEAVAEAGELLFEDNFDRPDLGDKWRSVHGGWKLVDGWVHSSKAHNRALWLQQAFKGNIIIEFDTRSEPAPKGKQFRGDIKIDVVNHRLKVEIEDGKVDARHIASAIGGQSSDSSADAYNATPTIGVSGSGADTVLKVLDNSINAAQLANATNSEYYGGLFAFTSDGSCAQIKGGDVGQVLTARGNSNPTFQTLYKDINLGAALGTYGFKRMKHGLSYTPTDIKVYIKCTGTTANADTDYYEQGDIVYFGDQSNDNAFGLFADATHVCYLSGQNPIHVRHRPFTSSAAANDSNSAISGTHSNASGNGVWSQITPSNWELHILAR